MLVNIIENGKKCLPLLLPEFLSAVETLTMDSESTRSGLNGARLHVD
jgi:hypothetical protein